MTGIDDAVELAAYGTAHTCARRKTGQVLCWGRNVDGQLGDNSTTSRYAPVPVVGMDEATAIASGYEFVCAIQNGSVYCWGRNSLGQLGDGTNQQRYVPVKVRFSSPISR